MRCSTAAAAGCEPPGALAPERLEELDVESVVRAVGDRLLDQVPAPLHLPAVAAAACWTVKPWAGGGGRGEGGGGGGGSCLRRLRGTAQSPRSHLECSRGG